MTLPDAIPLSGASLVSIARLTTHLCAGFPSPADDHLEEALDPARLLVVNEAATFLWRVQGHSMADAGILDGDLVVVDRSLEPRSGDVVVAVIDGLPSVKRLTRKRGRAALAMENAAMADLVLDEAAEASIWGVVTWSLTAHR